MLRVRVDVLYATHGSDDTSRFLTSVEVAAVFRVKVATVSRWVRQGKLDAVRTPGGRMLFRVTDPAQFDVCRERVADFLTARADLRFRR